MAIRGLSFSERNEYIPDDDDCVSVETGATAFYWRPLSSRTMARLSDMAQVTQLNINEAVQTVQQRLSARNWEIFKLAIVDWVNFLDDEGRQIQFSAEDGFDEGRPLRVVSDAAMNRVPLSRINQVANAIFQRNSLTADQRKKFAALLSRSGAGNTTVAENVDTSTRSNEDAQNPPIISESEARERQQ